MTVDLKNEVKVCGWPRARFRKRLYQAIKYLLTQNIKSYSQNSSAFLFTFGLVCLSWVHSLSKTFPFQTFQFIQAVIYNNWV